eukprot:scaffold20929_cov69-Cylindrotheca_fusiformis.AAC.3
MQHHEEAWNYNGQEEVPPTVRQLEEVILPSPVQVIGKWAFSWCRKLKFVLYQGLECREGRSWHSINCQSDWLLCALGMQKLGETCSERRTGTN